MMFGTYNAYYASSCEDGFKIEESFGDTVRAKCGQIVKFDEVATKTIAGREISVSNCLMEYAGAKPLKQPVMRIIVPVHNMQNVTGIIVLLTRQIRELPDEIEILEAVSDSDCRSVKPHVFRCDACRKVTCAWNIVVDKAVSLLILSCKQSCTGRSAHRTCDIRPVEKHRIRREFVKIRCQEFFRPRKSEITVSGIIRKNNQEVRPLFLCRPKQCRKKNCSTGQCCSTNIAFYHKIPF